MIKGDGLFTVITSGGVLLFVSACILICICMCLYLRFINVFVFTLNFFFVFDYSCIFLYFLKLCFVSTAGALVVITV